MTKPPNTESSNLWTQVAKAQAEFPEITKNKTVNIPGRPPYSYADLGSTLSAVRPILAKYGVVLSQPVLTVANQNFLVTTLRYSAEVFETSVVLPQSHKPQDFGSILTFYRRYALNALLGIHPEDDSDGEISETKQPACKRETLKVDSKAQDSTPSQTSIKPQEQVLKRGVVLGGAHHGKSIAALSDDELVDVINSFETRMRSEGKTHATLSPTASLYYQDLQTEMKGRTK